MYNFKIVNADTDSISFCKQDGTEFSKEEQDTLIKEINSMLPEKIKFENDGIFKTVICLKAKNYVLDDGKKVKKKGSSLKSSTLEPKFKEFLDDFIKILLKDKYYNSELVNLYYDYVRQVMNIKDIKPWAKKMTITDKTLKSERTNESKVRDAIEDSEYVEGDKIYCYFDEEENLKLAENFDGRYNKDIYLLKLFKTLSRFETILPIKELFKNYSLKRSKKDLEALLNPKFGVLDEIRNTQ